MKDINNQQVAAVFQDYPREVRPKMLALRELVIEVAKDAGLLDGLEETLRWGEPSYLVKGGSTIRMDWKPSSPQQYALYFTCSSSLVETFKEIYGDLLSYGGNRAVIFGLDEGLPVVEVKHCILMALEYKKRKHLALLGA